MPLAPGSFFGPYEVLSQLGAGGMGEVYKARDAKLDRFVAIKILPREFALSADLLARFESEAKAVAALSHPNVMGIHDFGREGEHPYAVMEFLEGETLRDKLKGGPLPPKRAMDYAQQIAEGLGEAHAKGIIHRDIKPENLFITKEGRVKVLDFGLAKQLPAWATGSGRTSGQVQGATPGRVTELGAVLGTVGYMAPEQVKGEPADHRTDIFALGLVLLEMLTGKQTFLRATAAQTLAATLDEEPTGLSGTRAQIPPGLESLILRCLEKEPGKRFQCMRDLAFDLRNLAVMPVGSVRGAPARGRLWLAAGGGAALVLVLALLAGRLLPGPSVASPTFQRLTFLPGTIDAARFGPDGRTVFFSERVAGGRPELFVLNPGAHEPRALGIKDALLLGVSGRSEVAFLRGSEPVVEGIFKGLLCRASGDGAWGVRDVQEGVAEAAWDGAGLVTYALGANLEFQLTFPPGKVLHNGKFSSEIIHTLRVSPDGSHLALVSGDSHNAASVVVYDRAGARRVLFTKEGDSSGGTLTGLGWGPRGDLWVSELQGDQTALWALSMDGARRPLWQCAGPCQLLDVSRDGQVLLAQNQARYGVMVQHLGEAQPRELSIQGGTQAMGVSADGRTVLLLESPSMLGGTARDEGYVRAMDGGQPQRLGPGNPLTLSPDGHWVQMDTGAVPGKDLDPAWLAAYRAAGLEAKDEDNAQARSLFVLFVANGVGQPFALPTPPGCQNLGNAYLLPDGQGVVANLDLKGSLVWVLLDRRGGAPRVLTRDGLGLYLMGEVPLSPDGSNLLVTGDTIHWLIQPVRGGNPRAIRGVLPGEVLLGWSADGKGVYVRSGWSQLPVAIHRLDPVTGVRRPVLAFTPPDPAGHVVTLGVFMSPDARAFAFTYGRKLTELYAVRGLK